MLVMGGTLREGEVRLLEEAKSVGNVCGEPGGV